MILGAVALALVGCGQADRGVLTGHLHLRGNVPHALSNGSQVVVSAGNTVVAYQYTPDDGVFRFSLPPGAYAVSVARTSTAESNISAPSARGTPVSAAVRTGATTVEDLNVFFQ